MNKSEASFLNSAKELEEKKYDFSIAGLPINSSYEEEGVIRGPDAIRNISLRYANADGSSSPINIHNPERESDLRKISIYDYGNIFNNTSEEETRNRAIKNAIEKSKIPIFLGGDHFITYPILENYDGELTVIQFDAHSDYLDDKNCLHGSVMRLINDLPNVNKIIHYGLRGNLNSKKDIEQSIKKGNVVILQKEIDEHQKEISDYLEKGSPVYISFDTDFLDPSIAFATGYPEPGGASYNQAKESLMHIMKTYDVKGIDMVEYNPDKDHNHITGNHLVNLIIEMMSVRNNDS